MYTLIQSNARHIVQKFEFRNFVWSVQKTFIKYYLLWILYSKKCHFCTKFEILQEKAYLVFQWLPCSCLWKPKQNKFYETYQTILTMLNFLIKVPISFFVWFVGGFWLGFVTFRINTAFMCITLSFIERKPSASPKIWKT